MTPAQFYALEQQNQQNRQEFMQGQMENVFGALTDLAGQYAQKEGMKRAGKAYKQTLPMFASALGMGDDQLKQFTGMDDMDLYYAMESMRPALPSMINAQLGQQRAEQAPVMQAQRVTDQRDIMYERERLQREREMMNTPQAPNPLAVPTAMRRFNKPI
jgi:hypothetical protein